MRSFADRCGAYEDLALEIHDSDPSLRDRLLLGAEGRPLYGRLKTHDSSDLFAGFDSFGIPKALREQLGKRTSRPTRKVLMITAEPLNASRLRIGAEYRDVQVALRQITNPKLDVVLLYHPAVRPGDLTSNILNHDDLDIIHFSGHADATGLAFEDASGHVQLVKAPVIAGYLKRLKLRCVVLMRVSLTRSRAFCYPT